MTTDDRDIESSNPASFKVGEADHLSGFFTPVWESKRRLRAESPIPASSAAASAPVSSRSAGQANPTDVAGTDATSAAAGAQPVSTQGPDTSKGSALGASLTTNESPPAAPVATSPARPSPAGVRRTSSRPPADAAADERASAPAAKPAAKAGPPRATRSSSSPPRASKGAAKSAAARGAAKSTAGKGAASKSSSAKAAPAEPAPTATEESAAPPAQIDSPAEPRTQRQGGLLAVSPEPAQAQPSDEAKLTPLAPPIADPDATPILPPVAEVAAAPAQPVTPAPPADLSAHPVAAALAAAAAAPVTVRPVIPMPRSPGRIPPRSKPPSAPPSAAAEALRRAGPNLDADAFIDREPDFRAPLGKPARAASAELQRSARAVSAAGAVHDKLRTKLQVESDEVFGRHRETESEREALQAAAARAAATPADPYPGQVLRTLRRTIHLSTPLPESVRQMLAKYR